MAMREHEILIGLGLASAELPIDPRRTHMSAASRIEPVYDSDALFAFGNISLDCRFARAWVDGRAVRLTAKDFHLALYLLSHQGRVLARRQIVDAVWRNRDVLASRTLDAHVSRIRRRLHLRAPLWSLSAVYGHGYRLDRLASRTPARDLPDVRLRRETSPAAH
jgi:DNA-binding response OmpR family regulator